MSRKPQATYKFIRRSINLFHRMKLEGKHWPWLEAKLYEEFPNNWSRWGLIRGFSMPDDSLLVHPRTIRRWVKDWPRLFKGRCIHRLVIGMGGKDHPMGWAGGMCIHISGVNALREWLENHLDSTHAPS